jgi:hypothetical protein
MLHTNLVKAGGVAIVAKKKGISFSALIMELRRTLLITAFADLKMSSQLNTFVPVLDGSNYQQWAAAMQSSLVKPQLLNFSR